MDNEELVKLYQDGDNKALNDLIELNRGIVYKIANKYKRVNRRYDIDSIEVPEDLVQAGYLGLIEAAQRYRFDIENKAKFITYSVYWIEREIYFCANGRGDKEVYNNKFYNECSSLNISIGSDNDTELETIIEDTEHGFENVEDKLYLMNLRKELEGVMQTQNTLKEREVLKLRYGWNTSTMTLNDIGEIFNIPGNTVRNIEHAALRKLRNSMWAKKNMKEFAELGYIEAYYIKQWNWS